MESYVNLHSEEIFSLSPGGASNMQPFTIDQSLTTEARMSLEGKNDTDFEHARFNLDVPHYLYREVPIVFELTGSILNIILIIYFIKSKKYKSPIFMILTSLAFMDFCVCFGGVGYAAFLFPIMRVPHLPFLCPLFCFIAPMGVMGSAYHLIFFAGLRLYQVARPLQARAVVTASLMAKICLGITIVIGSSQLAYGLHWHAIPALIRGEELTVCAFDGDNKKKDLAYMIFQTAIPCPTIFLLHVSKYFIFKWSSNSVVVQQERKNPDARVVALVIALFYITLIPSYVFMVIQHFREEGYKNTDDNLFLVLLHVLFSNSTMNPVVYVLALKSVRDDFINLCRKQHK